MFPTLQYDTSPVLHNDTRTYEKQSRCSCSKKKIDHGRNVFTCITRTLTQIKIHEVVLIQTAKSKNRKYKII